MTRENVLHRIKKLKALADDKANVNEAANAAAMAQKLIEKHRIEEAELFELTDEEDQEEVGEQDLETFNGTNMVRWRLDLANHLAYYNNCKTVSYRGNRRSKRQAKMTIVGRPSDVSTVRYLFQSLTRDIERLCKRLRPHGGGKSWSNSFRLGAVQAVSQKMKEAKAAARVGASTQALVRVDNAMNAVDAAMKEMGVGKARKYTHHVDPFAYQAGKRAGKNLNIGTAKGDLKESARQLQDGR